MLSGPPLGWLVALAAVLAACRGDAVLPPVGQSLFTEVPTAYSGVAFVNHIEDTQDHNVFVYRNYYNGGGVALGDLTGDGLPELYLTANSGPNTLYLNEGDFRFRDVTAAANVGSDAPWSTGVTFVDVNGDGLLDIYVSNAGRYEPERRANELYVHQGMSDGVPQFVEMAADYGLDDRGYSTHAAFFDYDLDGDLDAFVVNNSPRDVSALGLRDDRALRHDGGGDRLYRNDNGGFVDVSEAAGIFGNEAAFGLGVAVGDVTGDGWPDLYVSNDFFERDYLYINQQDGTFVESVTSRTHSTSLSSMGLDIADLNNDGALDLYVTDMLPWSDDRLKSVSMFEGFDAYRAQVRAGYHHQFMRNTLLENRGNGTFSEVGRFAGVSRTDWSWSALIADFDLDGHQDIHVTNGMFRDVTDQDYVAFLGSEETLRQAARGERVEFMGLIDEMPSTPLTNRTFRNNGEGTFSDASEVWGLDHTGFSNGAAFGDLDGDGALDLVVNNIGEPASVYRNNARTLTSNAYLTVTLRGPETNPFGIGARVTVVSDSDRMVRELMPSRGFQSSVAYPLSFGLGGAARVDSVIVDWPGGAMSTLGGMSADTSIVVAASDPVEIPSAPGPPPRRPPLVAVDAVFSTAIQHVENDFSDFRREPLLPRALSTEGPRIAVGDVNGDGRDDVFVGGAKDSPGQMLIQAAGGRFRPSAQTAFADDRVSEDLGSVLFDADGDGDRDLYVVSGGSEFSELSPALQDRLYLNDGAGRFTKSSGRIPVMNVSGAHVSAADFDADGDVDLLIGGRVIPWQYGMNPKTTLLRNDGTGRFTDVTGEVAPDLERVGMVTDGSWVDIDADADLDLVVVGEWMPIRVFENMSGRLTPSNPNGLDATEGWWNVVEAADFNSDGIIDFAVGNTGLNGTLPASPETPVVMYVRDFDRNGFAEQILARDEAGVEVPWQLRDDLIRAIPNVRDRFPTYRSYVGAAVADVVGPENLAGAAVRQVRYAGSSVALSRPDGGYDLVPLPGEVQRYPIHALLAEDIDEDGHVDLLAAGNFDALPPWLGRMHAGVGTLLRGDGSGRFGAMSAEASGFEVPGQVRDLAMVRTGNSMTVVVARSGDRVLGFRKSGA